MPSSGRTWQTSVPGEKRGLARDCDKTESTDIRKEKTSSPVISARHRSSLVLWVQYLLPLTAEEQTSGGQRFGRTLQLKNPRSAQRHVKNGVSRTELLVQGTDTSGCISPVPLSRILSLITNLKRQPG
ncbi:hypothetical protein CH63R_09298 [Colletotrichum higginsianum IMI 349063]|uniref:Uncharacterized protein n=1 Tax=Colletotrichum higginsianum (strain IMI 349063) TaxID=759273 RepID=A0A1B7Y6Z4_COLHI|nr:hypothetical protein CH63R_09298 [Colletotrichum higginsianum IMI 349063]OBR07777.1 hypothetical protein CH63R_09298 [Colletotrichum higginsianum IMI 349063]